MSEENKSSNSNNVGLKIALGLALALFIGTVFYTMNLYNESQSTENKLENDKKELLANLDSKISELDDAMKLNTEVSDELLAAKEQIQGLRDSLSTAEANVKTLWGFRNKYNSLMKDMKELLAQNEALKSENSNLYTSLDSTRTSLKERTKFSDSLLTQNTVLASVVQDASVLSAAGLKGFGVIEKSSGKLVPTEKAGRVDKIRVCFVVAKNNLVPSGDQELYIQVKDPSSNILGANEKIFLRDEAVAYSVVSKFNYEKRSLDVCEFVGSNSGGDFAKGTYTVKVYNQLEMVASSEFTLR